MNELILRWLNGKRNFTIGTLLYNQFGSNDDNKKLFAAGKNAVSEAALLKALQLLLEEKEIVFKKETTQHFEVMPDAGDDLILKSFKDAWLPFYTEMHLKRHRLDNFLEDESSEAEIKRAELAKDILHLEQQCIAIWAKRDYYNKHGQLPGKTIESEVVVDEFKAAKRIELLKTYLRQYKKKLRDNPGNEKSAAKITEFTNELKQLQQQYGGR